MTDLEFLERLRRELTASPAWNDIGSVVAAAADPDLAENELRVYPVPDNPASPEVSLFRVIVEWEVADSCNVTSTSPIPQPDEEPDGN